jgi:hypothetical protein
MQTPPATVRFDGPDWSVPVDHAHNYTVCAVTLDGYDHVYILLSQPIVPSASTSGYEVEVSTFPCLRVVEEGAMIDLTDIALLACSDMGLGGGIAHPGSLGAVVGGWSSPIATSQMSEGQYWVAAKGFSWKLISVPNIAHRAVTQVELTRSASLELSIANADEDHEFDVIILRSDSGGQSTFSNVTNSLVIDGLQPGRYTIGLMSKIRDRESQILDRRDVALQRGDAHRIQFDCASDVSDAGVRVTGYISKTRQSPSPDIEINKIVLKRVESPFRVEPIRREVALGDELRYHETEGYWEWSPIIMSPGLYSIELMPVGLRFHADVPSADVHVVDLELPEAFYAHIDFVDSSTSKAANVSNVMPTTLIVGQLAMKPGPPTVVMNAEEGSVELLAFTSPLHVMIQDGFYGVQHQVFELDATDPYAVFSLTRPLLLTLSLLSYGTEMFASTQWWEQVVVRRMDDGSSYLSAEHMPPEDASPLMRFGTSRVLIRVPGPGKYFIATSGDDAVSFEVDVIAGSDIAIDIGERTHRMSTR